MTLLPVSHLSNCERRGNWSWILSPGPSPLMSSGQLALSPACACTGFFIQCTCKLLHWKPAWPGVLVTFLVLCMLRSSMIDYLCLEVQRPGAGPTGTIHSESTHAEHLKPGEIFLPAEEVLLCSHRNIDANYGSCREARNTVLGMGGSVWPPQSALG